MKKGASKETVLVQTAAEMDIMVGLINKLEQHLISLEKKVDTLISRPPVQMQEKKFEQPLREDRERRIGKFRERKFYTVICADCKRECEVPFNPEPGRPVYCKECFSKRKSTGSLFKEKHDNVLVENSKIKKSEKKKKPAVKKAKKK